LRRGPRLTGYVVCPQPGPAQLFPNAAIAASGVGGVGLGRWAAREGASGYLAADLRRTCSAGLPRRSTHTCVRSFTRLTRAWRRRRRSPIERSSLSTALSSSNVASSCQSKCARLDVIRGRSPIQRSINPGDLNEPPLNTNTGNGKKFQTQTNVGKTTYCDGSSWRECDYCSFFVCPAGITAAGPEADRSSA